MKCEILLSYYIDRQGTNNAGIVVHFIKIFSELMCIILLAVGKILWS